MNYSNDIINPLYPTDEFYKNKLIGFNQDIAYRGYNAISKTINTSSIIRKIMNFLTTSDLSICLYVNKEFRSNAIFILETQKIINFSFDSNKLYLLDECVNSTLKYLINNSFDYLELKFMNPKDIINIIKNSKSIKHLSFSWQEFTPEFLKFLNSPKDLISLSIEYWRRNPNEYEIYSNTGENRSMNNLKYELDELNAFDNLQALSIKFYDDQTNKEILTNLSSLRKLKVLDIGDSKLFSFFQNNLSKETMINLRVIGLVSIPKELTIICPNIIEIIIYEPIDDRTIFNILGLNLKYITFVRAENINKEYLQQTIKLFPQIKYIGLGFIHPLRRKELSSHIFQTVSGENIEIDLEPEIKIKELCAHAEIS